MNYTDFSVEDFVMDPDFRKWVKENDDKSSSFWENWKINHPEKAEKIDEARQIVLLLDLEGNVPTREQYERVWARINAERQQDGKKTKHAYRFASTQSPIKKWGIRMAASFTLLLLAIGAYFMFIKGEQKVEYATAFGKTKTIMLPDSSEVTLNSNSSLSYRKGDLLSGKREVWLEGEAYFSVNERGTREDQAKFIVHTDYLDVQVLGTEFNVNQRRGKTQVVLSSGKVKLATKKQGKIENVVMEPGELVEYGENQEKVVKKVVNPGSYTSWRQNLLVIDNKTMHEIVQMLEDNYGLEIEVRDSSGFGQTLQGKLPAGNLDVILKGLSKSYDLNIQQKENKVIIKKRKK